MVHDIRLLSQFLEMGAQASASPFVIPHLACQTCQTLTYLASHQGAWEGGYYAFRVCSKQYDDLCRSSIAQSGDTTKHTFLNGFFCSMSM